MGKREQSPEEQLRAIFTAADSTPHVVAVLTSMRQQLIEAGWSAQGAEGVVITMVAGAGRSS